MKVIFKKDGFEFEEDINKIEDIFEFATLVKSVLYNLSDDEIKTSLEYYKTGKESNVSVSPNKVIKAEPELATVGQKKLMNKWNIQYTDKTTKAEAIDLINEFKKANGMAVNEELTKLAKTVFEED